MHVIYLKIQEYFRKETKDDVSLKITVLGNGGVGKSSTVIRFVNGVFVEEYDPTIEDSFRIMVNFFNTSVQLEILDTAGQESHTSYFYETAYIRAADCFIIISSIDQTKYLGIEEYCDKITQTLEGTPFHDIPIIFAINKIDLIDKYERNLSDMSCEIASCIEKLQFTNACIIESCAKSAHNVNLLFEECVRRKCVRDDYLKIIKDVIKYDRDCIRKVVQKQNCILC